ncbi:uncharacterized protein BT62DRAFT_1034482 [Guyanagaster necrorhizus]|uniref:Metallo-beta-lactamase domain-containing protein n=1 Tax=Guyanagaster necrorhizus TaxID=856835 RepID=A0A9P7VMZ8_9AGAR|nr:uncharacterized protein BT62DRAFT_1034482 [Guyanagaster necrorhizus MCA 3950]KAG7443530.1 hypothetical protein BT62DRAFT_1034482 [Guyanagaster necrorhizus MCA 3950]
MLGSAAFAFSNIDLQSYNLGFLLSPPSPPSTMTSSIPSSTSTIIVHTINAGIINFLPASLFFKPILPGYKGLSRPVYTFLIEHLTKRKVIFDLGMRKDQEKYVPVVQRFFDLFRELGGYDMGTDASKTVSKQLVKGVDLGSMDAVIWSHTHFNHIDDISLFPSATELVVGPGMDLCTYPEHEDMHLIKSDTASYLDGTLILQCNTMLHIADLPALDYFGDGSFYVLNTSGHHSGHISSLTHVTPTMFVLLGGDCCHHIGNIQPTAHHCSLCLTPS